MPNQKFGVVRMNRNTTRITWSTSGLFLTAASRPKVSVKTAAKHHRIHGQPDGDRHAAEDHVLTGWRNTSDVPKLPWTSPDTNSQYCSGNGRLRPSCSRRSARRSARSPGPRGSGGRIPGQKMHHAEDDDGHAEEDEDHQHQALADIGCAAHTLFVDVHILKAVVRQSVDEEAVDVLRHAAVAPRLAMKTSGASFR